MIIKFKGYILSFTLTLVCLFVFSISLHAFGGSGYNLDEETERRAIISLRIIQFTQYEEGSLEGEYFTVGIWGKSNILTTLENAISDITSVHGKIISIIQLDTLDQIHGCNAVICVQPTNREIGEILETIGSSPILTIGNSDELAQKGMAINLALVGRKFEFDVNLVTCAKSNISFSSRFLKLAKNVIR